MGVLSVFASVVVLAAGEKPDYDAMWEKFKTDYGKSYPANGNEEQQRFGVFKANVDVITETNAQKLSYTLGVNEFADLTWEEFSGSRLGYVPRASKFGDLPKVPFPNITATADALDWVAKGAVTPVKNQAQCGSCWAFSATGSMEGAYFIANNKLLSFSEEDLVECDHNGDMGCQGGSMDSAFGWVKTNGICTEQAYPYTSGGGQTGACVKKCSPAATLTGHTDVPPKNEDALKAAVSKGPVSVAIEADKSAFQSYSGGVLDNPACGTKLDHGVLIVGYGTDGGKDYWKVKNSWGASWGEKGYIRMVRGKDQCGIALDASYPTGLKPLAPGPGPAPGPSPAPPSPSGSSHYEDPATKGGCRSDEVDAQIQGVSGAFCAPICTSSPCPSDVPAGVTASPKCALQGGAKKYCALICSPSNKDDSQCGKNASCKSVQGIGLCTYDDDKESATRLELKYVPSQEQIVV